MVKVLDTSIASITVMAFVVNLRVALTTEHYLIFPIVLLDIKHQIVNWVTTSQVTIVIA